MSGAVIDHGLAVNCSLIDRVPAPMSSAENSGQGSGTQTFLMTDEACADFSLNVRDCKSSDADTLTQAKKIGGAVEDLLKLYLQLCTGH